MLKKQICLAVLTILATGAAPLSASGSMDTPLGQNPPPNENAKLLQGSDDYRNGNYEEALAELANARAQDPQSSAAAYYLGATLKKMQRYEEAIPPLLEAVSLQPPYQAAQLELADTYYALKRTGEALAAIAACEKEGLEPGQTAFIKGLALMQKHDDAEALISFKKAQTAAPELTLAADYQIATINHRLGRSTEANAIFQRVAAGDPESAIGQMARQQADALTAQLGQNKAFTAMANVQYHYDSNVILKPDNTASAVGISNKSDNAAALSLRAEYALPLTLPFGVKFQYSGYANFYSELTSYDLQSHTVGVSPSYRLGENTLSLPISFNDTLVDNKQYLRALAVAPTYSFVTGEQQYAQASATYRSKNFPQTPTAPAEDRSGSDLGAGISWFRLISHQKGFTNLKYTFTREKTDGANWDMQEHLVGAGILYPPADHFQLALGVEVFRQSFTNDNSLFGKKRTDTGYTANAQLLYALTPMFDAQLQYIWISNDSSLAEYTYHKNIIGAGLYAKF